MYFPPLQICEDYHSQHNSHLKTSEYLIDQKLNMVITEFLGFDYVVQVSSHKVGHQVPRMTQDKGR